jgi:pimeloyl-ACP methyl ester carboxylesterase
VLLIGGAAAVGVWGIWMFFRQPYIVFRPSREIIGDPGDLGLAFEDVHLRLPSGIRIHGWWIPGDDKGDDKRKLILCFPGSFGNISQEVMTVSFLRRLGATVFIVDYPGFGKSEGRPTERGCYAAAAAAWDYAVREKGIRPEDVILFGRSLGGAVASRLAGSHPDCAGLVIHSAFTSMPDVAARKYPFFPVRYFCYLRFNTLKYLRACRGPIVIMHPTNDTFIPMRHGMRLHENAPEPKQFIPLRGGHYGSEWQRTPDVDRALRNLIAAGESA